MNKNGNSYVTDMKDLTRDQLKMYIITWLEAEKGRTLKQFAELSGLSLRTIKKAKNYQPGREFDPCLSTIEKILLVVRHKAQAGPIDDDEVIK